MRLSPDAEINRLMRYALRLRIGNDEAWDFAASAYLTGLEQGCTEWYYTSKVLKNAVMTHKRNRKRRNEDYAWTFLEGDSEPLEVKRLSVKPNQENSAILADTIAGINALPSEYQPFIKLAALEYTADEIADELGVEKREVRWRLQRSRKLLRDRGYDEITMRGDSHFIGIRRDCRKWVAATRKGKEYYHLGYFDTASEAAKAYDAAARKIHGPKAKLNYPEPAA